MNPQTLIDHCLKSGVTIHINAGAIKLRGSPEAVKSLSNKLRPHKAALLFHLSNEETQCDITPELNHELNTLFAKYKALFTLSEVLLVQIFREIATTKHESTEYRIHSHSLPMKFISNPPKGITS